MQSLLRTGECRVVQNVVVIFVHTDVNTVTLMDICVYCGTVSLGSQPLHCAHCFTFFSPWCLYCSLLLVCLFSYPVSSVCVFIMYVCRYPVFVCVGMLYVCVCIPYVCVGIRYLCV